MSNYNKVLLMGRLTRDPELRYTPQGTPVSAVGIAINREYTVGTERRKETTFVEVTLWRRQAEVVCQYLKKGAPLFVEGRLTLDTWETPDGQKRSRLKVVADNFQFLGGRSENGAAGGGGYEEAGESGYGGESYGDQGQAPGGRRQDWGGRPQRGPQGPSSPRQAAGRGPASFAPRGTRPDRAPPEGTAAVGPGAGAAAAGGALQGGAIPQDALVDEPVPDEGPMVEGSPPEGTVPEAEEGPLGIEENDIPF